MHKDKLAFDIGCNVGNKTEYLLKQGYRVVAVDANKKLCLHLKTRFPQALVLNYLVSNTSNEQKDFWLCKLNIVSSASINWVFNGRFKNRKWNKIQVETITLDALIQAHGIPDFIKIDVEGYEANVLGGLSQPIKNIGFEWSEEIYGVTLMCIAKLNLLGKYKFSFTERDTMGDKQIPIEEIGEMIAERKKRWGMIYAELIS